MSSTGTVQKYKGGATTLLKEQERQTEGVKIGPSLFQQGIHIREGYITEVHESQSLIKAQMQTGVPLGGGGWIPLLHSRREVLEQHGTLKKNMKVAVFGYREGIGLSIAYITEITEEEKKEGPAYSNEFNLGFYACCPPGSTPI